MVKSVLGVKHQGLNQWVLQRLSALFMIFYIFGLIAYIILHPKLSYMEWHDLFSHAFIKIFSVIFFLSIIYHAWIGMWTIFTDYVKPFVLRAILDTLVLLSLSAFFIWGIMILWSV